jgi:predicted transcriptional regulator
MSETHSVTLPSHTYERVAHMARARQQSVEEVIDEIDAVVEAQNARHAEIRGAGR